MRGLLLDFDGTIAETERFGHRVAYNRAFAELGLDWDWDERLYGELLAVAGGNERIRAYLRRYRPEVADADGTPALIAAVYRAKIRHFARIAGTVAIRPGVLRLLREAHAAGVRIAIATTAARQGVEAVLRPQTELWATIDLIAASENAARKKPAPDVYLWALDQLGLDAAACVAVEDSGLGLRAALAAHLTTLVTVSDYTAGDDFTGAAAVVTDLGEPGRPGRSIGGPPPAHGIVDLAYLQALARNGGGAPPGS